MTLHEIAIKAKGIYDGLECESESVSEIDSAWAVIEADTAVDRLAASAGFKFGEVIEEVNRLTTDMSYIPSILLNV